MLTTTVEDKLNKHYQLAKIPRLLGVWSFLLLFALPIAVPVGLKAEANSWWILPWLGSCLAYASLRNQHEEVINKLEWQQHHLSGSKSSGPRPYSGYFRETYASFCVASIPWTVYLLAID